MRLQTKPNPSYSFKANDDWGDYCNGKYRNGTVHTAGYRLHNYNCTDGKTHRLYEHVAKWEYFNGNIPDGMEIDHIIPISNGGTNKLSNLRCVTHEENCNNENSFENKRKSHKGQVAWNKGVAWSDDVKKKISDTKEKREVVQIENGAVIATFESVHDAERKTGVKHTNISRCCRGGFYSKSRNKWVNVYQMGGFKWMFKDDYEKMLAERPC
jgi:hypothetical protein